MESPNGTKSNSKMQASFRSVNGVLMAAAKFASPGRFHPFEAKVVALALTPSSIPLVFALPLVSTIPVSIPKAALA